MVLRNRKVFLNERFFFLILTVLTVAILTVPYSSLSSHILRTILAPFSLATYIIFDKGDSGKERKAVLKFVKNNYNFDRKEIKMFIYLKISIFLNFRKKSFTLRYENSAHTEETLSCFYLHDCIDVFDAERYIPHAVPVSREMFRYFSIVRLVRRLEHEYNLRIRFE